MEPSAAQADRLREFAERTRTNLMFIERHVRENPASAEVYEVTQLLNSLLWLVVAADEWLVIDDTVSLETLRHEVWGGKSRSASGGSVVDMMKSA